MLAAGAALTQTSADFLGGIPWIPLVEQVADRGKALSVPALAVHAVVDGNEPHIVAGEDDVGVLAYGQIVTTEAAEVFAEPAAHQSLLYQFKALLYARALKVRAGIAVVNQHFQVCVAMILCVSG